jgi:hypothetical protein
MLDDLRIPQMFIAALAGGRIRSSVTKGARAGRR